MLRSVKVKAKTLDDALNKASELLGVDRRDIEYEVLSGGRGGLWSLKKSWIVIRASAERQPQDPMNRLMDEILSLRSLDTSRDKDGTIAIEDGRFIITSPIGNGKYPSLTPGQNVAVFINGQPITGTRVVFEDDKIEVKLNKREPVRHIAVEVSPDKLKAYLTITLEPGIKYELCDKEASNNLLVSAVPFQESMPEPFSMEEINDALKKAGVVYGIDRDAVEDCFRRQSAKRCLVAEGEAPEPSEDGRIEYLFSKEIYRSLDPDPQTGRIDYYELLQIPSVKPGEVLAVVVPPKEGKPGKNVLGEEIMPRRPKPVRLSAGKGVRLIEHGTKAIAVQAGRPIADHRSVRIIPVHIVEGDANVETGNIRFDGDIHVLGNVEEMVRIKAEGRVTVHGLVSDAVVEGEHGVVVGKNIIRSRVTAGGEASKYNRLLVTLSELEDKLLLLIETVRMVKSHPRFNSAPVIIRDGLLVKFLLEQKFSNISFVIRSLRKLRAGLKELEPDIENAIYEVFNTLNLKLLGRGPLGLDDASELRLLIEKIEHLKMLLREASTATTADIVAKYVQNSVLEATGIAKITGQACYNSQISASRGVQIPWGVFRGGEITVLEGDIFVNEFGSPAGTVSSARIIKKGEFKSRVVHPNTSISIGGQGRSFPDGARSVRVYLDESGELQTEVLKTL